MKIASGLIIPILICSTPGCGPARPAAASAAPGPKLADAPEATPSRPSFDRDVAPVLARHCRACHDSADADGGVDLVSSPPDSGSRALWARVAGHLRSDSMPPPGEPRPSEAERDLVASWVEAEVLGVVPGPGRVTLRRLNRSEYNHTVRDLFGLDLRPADDFPADDVGHGFDNNGEVLSIPPILMEKYVEAAARVVDAAFADPAARARILVPGPDPIPPADRGYRPPARSEPRKRVGVPSEASRRPDPELARLQVIYDVLRGVADRAYRRPASHDDLTRLVQLAESTRGDGAAADDGLKLAVRAILVSPRFLFHVEADPSPTIHRLDDFELAARLSYFLWSSLPDEELSASARRGELRGERLAGQVRRMLRDDRARALAEDFAGQWLQTRNLRELAPDPALFPEFDEPLRRSMAREAELFVGEVIRADLRVADLVDAPFTYVDARLARHYGIAGVSGPGFRRVSVAGSPRGGVLTMAGVLAVTSNPTRTSPVKRGRWVLDNILGLPPAPAPPGAGDLREADGPAAVATLRERLERHRSDPRCASCHDRMDPLGFALEDFDAIGAWRDPDGTHPVDATGSSPGLGIVRGPAGLRSMIAARRGAFARCLAEKLLTYALGRGLGPGDRRAVDRVVGQLEEGDGRFSALVLAIVQSEPFQCRDGRSVEP